jgi:hypothetical protein
MSGDGPRCQSCGKPWAYHRGCQELCAENLRLTRELDKLRVETLRSALQQSWDSAMLIQLF